MTQENRREPTQETQRIARRVAQFRRKNGISQMQLCETLGLTQSMMSRYETGQRRIPSELLAEFAKIIGVSSDELLGITASKKNNLEMNPETKTLWKKFQQVTTLSKHDQRAVIRLINSLARAKAKA